MKRQLEIFRQIQDRYPTASLGGSLGLLLQGIDLQRNWKIVDLDITVNGSEEVPNLDRSWNWIKSIGEDPLVSIDMEMKFITTDGIKIEIQVVSEDYWPTLTVVHDDIQYRCTAIRHILEWKSKYAYEHGVKKHQDDLVLIKNLLHLSQPTAYYL